MNTRGCPIGGEVAHPFPPGRGRVQRRYRRQLSYPNRGAFITVRTAESLPHRSITHIITPAQQERGPPYMTSITIVPGFDFILSHLLGVLLRNSPSPSMRTSYMETPKKREKEEERMASLSDTLWKSRYCSETVLVRLFTLCYLYKNMNRK